MKKIIFIIFCLIAVSLSSELQKEFNLGFETPEIYSQTQTHILNEKEKETSFTYSPEIAQFSKFFDAISKLFNSKSPKPLFLYNNQRGFVLGKLLAGGSFQYDADINFFQLYYGAKIQANIKNKLFFYSRWWITHFDKEVNSIDTNLNDSWHHDKSIDNLNGKIFFKSDLVNLAIGRGKYEIGNNIGGSIILNDACNEYGYFTANFDFDKIQLAFMHSSLIPDSSNAEINNDALYYKNYEDKFLSFHKINWKPNKNFELFLGEEVVYGSRSIDVNYLLPATFYRVTEHNLRDRDNVLIFTGFNWKYTPKNLLYFNFIFDELAKRKIFTNWWGNKYAFQIGNAYNFNEQNRLIVEFTGVRPWIYTHKILVNKFSHDDYSLGFPAGSNLFQLSSELNLGLLDNLFFNTNLALIRQGSVGNHFSINYNIIDDTENYTTNWLEGTIVNKLNLISSLKWQPNTNHVIKLAVQREKTENETATDKLIISYLFEF